MPSFFSVPDKEKNYQSYMVYVLVLIWTGVISLIVSAGFFFFPHIWQRWLVFIGVALLIGAINLTLNHLNHTRTAAWLFTFMLWAFITMSSYSSGGIMSPVILSQLSVILTAGFLLGGRGGVAFALLSVSIDFVLAYIQLNGHLPVPTVQHTPVTYWIGALIAFGTILALQYYATNHLRNSLVSLQHEIQKREATEKEKDVVVHHVGERMKELEVLYAVSRMLQDERVPAEKLFQQIADVIPKGWQHSSVAAACVCLADTDYTSADYRPSKYNQRTEMHTGKGTKVCIEVVYLNDMPKADEGPFLKEERSLINMLVEMLKVYVERRERTAELLEYKYALDEAAIVSIADVNACFTHVNDNFCRVTKYTRAELLGKHHSVLWSGVHTPEDFDELKAAMQSGDPYTGEFCNAAKDGTLYWTDSTIVPFLNEGGKVYQYVSINYDITERKTAEEKIKHSEERYRSIITVSNTGAWEYHLDTERVWYSAEYFAMLGINQPEGQWDDGMGSLWIERLHPDDRESSTKLFTDYLEGGLKGLYEAFFRMRHENGEWVWIWSRGRRLRDENGNLTNVTLGTHIDVSERVKAQEKIRHSEEKNRAMIENMWDGLVLLDSNMEVIYQSPSVERITGYTLEERKNKQSGAYTLVYPDDAPILKGALAKALANPNAPINYQIRAVHKSGSIVWLDVNMINLLGKTGVEAIMVNYSDITERKVAADEIKALNESLELKVEKRTAELQEANQMLESFSYSVSHDLRAPVRNISSFAQLLDKMLGETISAQQKEIVAFIKEGADKMNQLISDLLEFSRADRQSVKIETVDMNELVHSVIKGLNGNNTVKTKFEVNTLPVVHADKALLQQVWINLISNAVKYSGKKDTPLVEIGIEPAPEEIVFYVKDNGAGFDMKNTEKLFGVFQRLHSSKEFEGTGVGLSIVKRIIQKHGGRIWADAKLNEGATFYFTLPQNHN